MKVGYLRAAPMVSAIALMAAWSADAATDDAGRDSPTATAVGEVVVTGSYIPRSQGVEPASPVDTISTLQIQNQAPQTVATLLKDIPENFGSTFSSGRALGGGERGLGTVNLRGLGPAATLVLVDGQRQVQVPDNPDNVVDINSVAPEIMLSRFEIVKDGSSALYGSDAVAGVVNIITKDNYKGLQISARASDFTWSSKGDRKVEVIWGGEPWAGAHLVLSGGYWNQDSMITGTDTPMIPDGDSNIRYTVVYSTLSLPTRNAAGALTTTRKSPLDPSCGQVVGTITGVTALDINGNPTPAPFASATQCRYLFFDDNASQAAINQWQGFASFHQDLGANTEFKFTAGYTAARVLNYYTAGDSVAIPLTIPGTNPGNTFRAVNASGAPLYAVAAGAIDQGYQRNGAEVFAPPRDGAGNVILNAGPDGIVGTADDNIGGVAFNEDIGFSGRLLGSQGALPTNNSTPQGAYSLTRPSIANTGVLRLAGGFKGTFFNDWNWQVNGAYSDYSLVTNNTVGQGLTDRLTAAVKGLGGPNCTGTTPNANGCSFFNPFLGSTFATPGSAAANSQALINWIFPLLTDRLDSSLFVGEAIVSGHPFKLPGGEVGFAAGYQFRRNALSINYDQNRNNNNNTANVRQDDFSKSISTNAVFAEAEVPIFDSDYGRLEFDPAVRWEKTGTLSSVSPKFGVLYETPNHMLSLRGTYGASFVAPSLFRLFATSGGATALNDCAPSVDPHCTGIVNVRVSTQTQGNPNLLPQTSQNYNLGATFKPISNLTLSADWWRYNFKNLITVQTPASVLASDPAGSTAANCAPVCRDSGNALLKVYLSYVNAPAVVTSGWDFSAKYNLPDTALGDFSVQASATYVPVYQWTTTIGGTAVNYAGQSLDSRGFTSPASPKWRANFMINWSKGPNALNARINYTGDLLFNKNAYLNPTTASDRNFANYTIPAYATLDLTYTFTLDASIHHGVGEGSTLQFGVVNLTDALPPFVPAPGFQPFIGTIYDIRGREIWAKITANF